MVSRKTKAKGRPIISQSLPIGKGAAHPENDLNEEMNTLESKYQDTMSKPVLFGFAGKRHRIPLFFLGLAAYRAWIEIVFVGSFVDFPAQAIAGHDAFDLIMAFFLLLFAATSKKISPFFNRKWAFGVAASTMLISTLCTFISFFVPELALFLSWPAVIAGGLGVSLCILLWSELYGCLNPIRVALYYSASLAAAALIIYLSYGFFMPWLFAITLALPIISLISVSKGFNSLPPNELPSELVSRFSFPWKIVLLMAMYAFAFGLREAEVYSVSSFGSHGAVGTLVIATLICIGVYAQGRSFDFALLYRVALPLMVGAFLILPNLGFINLSISHFCLTASYTAFQILIMIIFSNICYRYGVSAVWLFGIERGVRALFSILGRQTSKLLSSYGLISGEVDAGMTVVIVILVVAMTTILLTEKELSSKWGMSFLGSKNAAENDVIIKKEELSNRCHTITKEYGLSQREEEVLLLLAQKKTIGTIERELFIANGTAKTHIRHIYRKLDVHSRDELIALLGLHL